MWKCRFSLKKSVATARNYGQHVQQECDRYVENVQDSSYFAGGKVRSNELRLPLQTINEIITNQIANDRTYEYTPHRLTKTISSRRSNARTSKHISSAFPFMCVDAVNYMIEMNDISIGKAKVWRV